jgi:hypothetical protein
MPDREVGLPGEHPDPAVPKPAACIARVEHKGPFDHCDGAVDILGKIRRHAGGLGQYGGVIAVRLKSVVSELDCLAPVLLRIVGLSGNSEELAATGRNGERRAKAGITLDGPL